MSAILPAPLSWSEKLHLAFSILKTLLSIPCAIISFAFLSTSKGIDGAYLPLLSPRHHKATNQDGRDKGSSSSTSPAFSRRVVVGRRPSLADFIAMRAIRTLSSTATIREMQFLSRPTLEVYGTFMKSIDREATISSLEAQPGGKGAALCWLYPPLPSDSWPGSDGLTTPVQNKHVILFFHGGGYVSPASSGHFQFLWETVVAGSSSTKPDEHENLRSSASTVHLSVAILSYTLAPHGTFPTQLRQAAAALRFLLDDLHLVASQIVLAGDSAGGNLALALLGHCCRPCPGVEEIGYQFGSSTLDEARPPLSQRHFAGLVLVSPWVGGLQKQARLADTRSASRGGRHSSWIRNAGTDCLAATTLDTWADALLGDLPEARDLDVRQYYEPLAAGESWWKPILHQCLRGLSSAILVTVGANEVFASDIMEFGEQLKNASDKTKIELRVYPGEAHDEVVLDYILGRRVLSTSTQDVRAWLWNHI